MTEQQLFVLRVWRDSHMEIHATLKGGKTQETTHFANLAAAIEFIKTQFEPPSLESEKDPS